MDKMAFAQFFSGYFGGCWYHSTNSPYIFVIPRGMVREFVINHNSASEFPSYDDDNRQNTERLTSRQSVSNYSIFRIALDILNVLYKETNKMHLFICIDSKILYTICFERIHRSS